MSKWVRFVVHFTIFPKTLCVNLTLNPFLHFLSSKYLTYIMRSYIIFVKKMGFYGLELLNVIYKVLKRGTARGKGALEATFSS